MSLFKIFSKNKKGKPQSDRRYSISTKINNIFSKKRLDEETLQDLEDLLLMNDVGTLSSNDIIQNIKQHKFSKDIDENEIKLFLAKNIEKILKPCEKELDFSNNGKVKVAIFNGVNGSGKTTTIGKIAQRLSNENKKVVIAACDTFRAAAAEQLKVWANRANCQIVEAEKLNQDPASVAFKAFKIAQEENADILLIDTAGRLQNKQNLMDELKKINNVLRKIDDDDEIYENILVLDGSTGQNAKNQLETFNEIVNINGLIITKLDGSAKGGILISLAQEFQKPIYAIGVGENIEDLQEFCAKSYAESLVGIS